MAAEKDGVRMFPNIVTPSNPVVFNEEVCKGCNNCVETCVMDILAANPEKGKPPIILYPDECWYDGLCVQSLSLLARRSDNSESPDESKGAMEEKDYRRSTFASACPTLPLQTTSPP